MKDPSKASTTESGNHAADFETPEVDLQQRLDFLGLTDADAQRLRELVPKLRSSTIQIVENIFEYLMGFEETADMLQEPAQLARLKQFVAEHLISMLEARWDKKYLQSRRRAGQTHAESGVTPEYFLGTYNQFILHSFRILASDYGDDVEAFVEQILPLLKAIVFDIGLALDAYFEQSTHDLCQALDLYWKANCELRRFAELASHDLKTPLATVANLCEEVNDEFGDQIPAEAKELIEKARQRSFRMSSMIDELLAAALSDQSAPASGEIPSENIIREAIDRVRPLLEQKHIEINVSEALPYVIGDKTRLREAFFNVISNAAKFINKSPGKIDIGVKLGENQAVFSITDNGPGIPEEELQRIFIPFRRLPKHRHLPGSGLGLYFTKKLIEQHDGQIWAESKQGEGSCFYLLLKRDTALHTDSVKD